MTPVPASEKLVGLLRRLCARGQVWAVPRGNVVDIVATSRISATGLSVQRTISAGTLNALERAGTFILVDDVPVPPYDPARRSQLYRAGSRLVPRR